MQLPMRTVIFLALGQSHLSLNLSSLVTDAYLKILIFMPGQQRK